MSDRFDVFVGNLTFNTTEEQLRGPVKNIRILLDKESGKPKGFAFVEYFDTNTALSAIRHLDQTELNSRKIKVGYPAQSNLKDVARQIGQVVPESSADIGNLAIGSSSVATRIQIEQSVINSLKLHEAWDILEAMKKLVSEDNNRGHKAKGILQTHPQLINAVYEIQKKLGIPLPKHIQQQQLTNMTSTSDFSSNVVNSGIVVEGISSGNIAPRFSSSQQQQLFPGDVRTLTSGSHLNVGNIKATTRSSHQQQQSLLTEQHPYSSVPPHLASSFQANQPPPAMPFRHGTRQYAPLQQQQLLPQQLLPQQLLPQQQYLPPPPQDSMGGGGYKQGYHNDNSSESQFNPYSGGQDIISNQQQYNNNTSFDMQMMSDNNNNTSFDIQMMSVDPNMMYQQQQQQGVHSNEQRRSRFSSNTTISGVNDHPNNNNNNNMQFSGGGGIVNAIGAHSSEDEFNASMESYLLGGRPPNMMIHPHR